MTETPDAPPPLPPPLPEPYLPATGWRPLPRRGALPYALGPALGLAFPAVPLGLALSAATDLPRIAAAVAAALLGAAAGLALGLLRHRRIGWKLDADGLAIRRGGLWRVETLVPVSRVQHLDLERGPLERRLGLATLVVHTAGTRLAAVRLPLLALEDAEALRAHLARQTEVDDAL